MENIVHVEARRWFQWWRQHRWSKWLGDVSLFAIWSLDDKGCWSRNDARNNANEKKKRQARSFNAKYNAKFAVQWMRTVSEKRSGPAVARGVGALYQESEVVIRTNNAGGHMLCMVMRTDERNMISLRSINASFLHFLARNASSRCQFGFRSYSFECRRGRIVIFTKTSGQT